MLLLGAGSGPTCWPRPSGFGPIIEQHARIVCTDFTGTEDLSSVEADLAIVLGGDGSILRAARQMGQRQVPVVAINLGKLGFLANMSPAELPDVLRDFVAGKLQVIEHLMFECSVLRGGKSMRPAARAERGGVQAGTPFALIDIDLYVDSDLVTTYSCDGLIISTPVGSTAHCLSAGGPILRKNLQAFVVLPLSPHTLTMRPVVDSADCVYEMVVERPNAGNVGGGRRPRVVPSWSRATACAWSGPSRSSSWSPTPSHTYYRTLREKLGWGGRLKLNDGT